MLLKIFLSLFILSGIALSVFAREKTNPADYFYSKGLKSQIIFHIEPQVITKYDTK